eukprot:scaffold1238_cov116-Isochrysis_galbana.AAC.7
MRREAKRGEGGSRDGEGAAAHIEVKVDCRHDAVAALLVDQRLDRLEQNVVEGVGADAGCVCVCVCGGLHPICGMCSAWACHLPHTARRP